MLSHIRFNLFEMFADIVVLDWIRLKGKIIFECDAYPN